MTLVTGISEWGASHRGDPLLLALRDLVHMIRPRRILETGTYDGTGTTTAIASALKEFGLPDADFRSIEVDPARAAVARENTHDLPVRVLTGLSIPRDLLPDAETIKNELADLQSWAGPLFADYEAEYRPEMYVAETAVADGDDDLIGSVLEEWEGRCDLVVLDSAGHLGYREFNAVLARLRTPCYWVLDDTRHVKHARSMRAMRQDPHFRVVEDSDAKFGFAVAQYQP